MTWTLEKVEYPILPSQIRKREADPLIGEKTLVVMCIREAIQCYQGHAVMMGEGPTGRIRAKRNAKRWFWSNSTDVYSFLWCCKTLGLDPVVFLDNLDKFPKVTLHRKEYGQKKRKRAREEVSHAQACEPAGGIRTLL